MLPDSRCNVDARIVLTSSSLRATGALWFQVAEVSESIGYAGIANRRLRRFLALMLKTHHIETVSKHLCVDQKTSSTGVKAPGSKPARQTLTHGIPALALVAGARVLHSRDVTSTFTDFILHGLLR